MDIKWIILICVAALLALALITSFVCFYMVFYSPKRKPRDDGEIELPRGKIYEAFRDKMIEWGLAARALPHRDVEMKSFDGTVLRGKYYEHTPDAPIELMFHGYRGSSARDMSGGIFRCFELGHSALIVDQRGCGRSDGHVITFGIKESRDCVAWVDYILAEIDPSARIILTGVSMGAATVMITSAKELPENVIGVLADCGYTSAKDIIKKVIKKMNLPADILYPFVKLGARIYGGFNLEESSPREAMKKCRLPIFFVHGDTDDFVPCEMSTENYETCVSENKHITYIKGAGHGLAYPVGKEDYMIAARKFFDSIEK